MSSAADHFDQLETRDPEQRELAHFNLLPGFLARVMESAPGWKAHLNGVDPASIVDRQALAKLPVIRKGDLKAFQGARPPLGGLVAGSNIPAGRVFMSPGPIFEPEGMGEDWWRSARALFAAGFRKGDIVHNTFAYHLTPGGWILDAGARSLGCTVIPAGPGNTEQQLEAIAHLKPNAYVGVPDISRSCWTKRKRPAAMLHRSNVRWYQAALCFPRCVRIIRIEALRRSRCMQLQMLV